MRKQSVTSIIMLVCFIVIAATSVKAQNTHRFVIDIPFQFAVRGEKLPAGKYFVERLDPTKPHVVMLRSVDNAIVRLLITQRVENDDANRTSSLLFTVHGEQYFLFQVWMMGERHGNQVQSGVENTRLGRRGPSTIVRLRITNKKV